MQKLLNFLKRLARSSGVSGNRRGRKPGNSSQKADGSEHVWSSGYSPVTSETINKGYKKSRYGRYR